LMLFKNFFFKPNLATILNNSLQQIKIVSHRNWDQYTIFQSIAF
jgi:hypothetical protein